MIKDMLNSVTTGAFVKGSAVLGIAAFAVMMIRNAQKDSKELQLKLDELIAAIEKSKHDTLDDPKDDITLQKTSYEQDPETKRDNEAGLTEESITYYRYK